MLERPDGASLPILAAAWMAAAYRAAPPSLGLRQCTVCEVTGARMPSGPVRVPLSLPYTVGLVERRWALQLMAINYVLSSPPPRSTSTSLREELALSVKSDASPHLSASF